MKIERTSTEIIFRLPLDTNIEALQQFVNYLKIQELIQGSTATEEAVDELADVSKRDWWQENKHRFIP
jgi:hypothetical protein